MPSQVLEPDATVQGITALRTAANNAYSRFGYVADDPKTAGWRLTQRAAVDVHFTPKFHLTPIDAIFTMGSCFARNVESSLIDLGVRVLLADFDFPIELFNQAYGRLNTWQGTSRHGHLIRSVLNKYSPLSMLSEFQRVLEPGSVRDPFKGLIQVDSERWYDPQVKNTAMLGLDDALRVRELVESATARVTQASAIFLTLGFTETWLDSETGIALNVAPRPMLIKKWPDRFRFFNATHRDVMQSLEKIFELLTRRIRPDLKFIVTVSPVPLGTTFTEMDVISANAYSKATLRSVAGEFCARHPNVDYFPSYEMVMSTSPDIAWDADKVHVTQELVDTVIGRFVRAYFPEHKIAAAV